MTELYAIFIFLFVLFLLLGSSVWVGLALMGVAWVGMELFTSRPAGDAMITTIWTGASSWTLTALPLFIWMGEILFRTRLSQDLFRGLAPWLRFLPGGLLHTNIAGCTIFAAVSGSSAATLNMVGKMSIPELRSRGYPEHMIIGTLAGAATLGLMIPPSLTLIVYGVSINESITKLFMAGIFPGLVLSGLFMAYIVFWHFTTKGPRPTPEPTMSFGQMMKESMFLLPVMGLVFVVIGSMYTGYATATEAAAVGVVGALTLSAFQGSLNWKTFSTSLMGATRTSAMIALILMGAAFLSLSMGFTGLPRAMAELIEGYNLSPIASLSMVCSYVGYGTVETFFGFMIFVGLGNGLTIPNATAGMLSVRPHLAGTASGLGGAMMIAIGAALSTLAGAFLIPGSNEMPLLMLMWFSSLSGVAVIIYVRQRNKRLKKLSNAGAP